MSLQLTLTSLPDLLTICKLNSRHNIPEWATNGDFWAITRTPDELSIVCSQSQAPANVPCEAPWRALKVEGPLDFALIGILAALANTLAEAGISIFALSTFDTDYLLVKADKFDQAVQTLQQAGHSFHHRESFYDGERVHYRERVHNSEKWVTRDGQNKSIDDERTPPP
jgi:hypothetical protein